MFLLKIACSQQACLKCCADESCSGHYEQRQYQIQKDLILNSQHPINLEAKKIRELKTQAGAFHEPALKYMNESLLIWSFDEYMKNQKWRDDSIRKSRRFVEGNLYKMFKFKERKQIGLPYKKESRRIRFKRVMDHLYRESLNGGK